MDIKAKKTGIIFHDNKQKSLDIKHNIHQVDKNISLVIAENFDDFYLNISEKDFDCIFIDHKISKVNSIQLIQKLRKTRKFARSMIGLILDNKTDISKEDAIHNGINILINEEITNFNEDYLNFISNYHQRLIPKDFHVLIVDDDPSIVEILGEYLKDSGHKDFKSAFNFSDANIMVCQFEFDLILVDWNLGDGTCLDLIDTIRNKTKISRTKDATVIVITGRNEIDDLMTLVKYKINDHIIKPFDYDEFEEKVEYALEKKAKSELDKRQP